MDRILLNRRREKMEELAATLSKAREEAAAADPKAACLQAAKAAEVQLSQLIQLAPERAARFLDVDLLRDPSGAVARSKDGKILGYSTFPFKEVQDPDLSNALQEWSLQNVKACNRGR